MAQRNALRDTMTSKRLSRLQIVPFMIISPASAKHSNWNSLTVHDDGNDRQSLELPMRLRFAIPLAPLAEQRRIVAEIEKQFTRLEAGVAALRRVQANLKRYRAAVLKAACEGRLVPTEAELAKSEPKWQRRPAAEAEPGRLCHF